MQTYFADAILSGSITGQLVDIEFGTATVVDSKDGKPEVRLLLTRQVLIPLEGFVPGGGAREQAIKKRVTDGVLTVQPPSGAGGAAPGGSLN